MHSPRFVVVAAVAAGLVAACSNGSGGVNTSGTGPAAGASASSSASSSTGSSPAGSSPAVAATIDPAAQPAVDAYLAFSGALSAAERKPFGQNEAPARGADFTPMSVDPMEVNTLTYIWGLKASDVHYAGTSPVQHVKVATIDLKAADYPTVILTDCQTEDGWGLYQGTSSTPVPDETVKIPPPYTAKVTVIKYKGVWSVKDLTVDQRRTCAP